MADPARNKVPARNVAFEISVVRAAQKTVAFRVPASDNSRELSPIERAAPRGEGRARDTAGKAQENRGETEAGFNAPRTGDYFYLLFLYPRHEFLHRFGTVA